MNVDWNTNPVTSRLVHGHKRVARTKIENLTRLSREQIIEQEVLATWEALGNLPTEKKMKSIAW